MTDEKVMTGWDYAVFAVLSGVGLGAIARFGSYWVSAQDWRRSPVAFTTITAMLAVVLLSQQLRWFLLLRMRRPKPAPPRPGWKVAVVTTFVPGLESFQMLEETVTALVNLDYPHDTWVLDEGDAEAIKQLCQRLGARHFSRKDQAQYQTDSGVFQARSKHGNYNAWLDAIGFDRYDVITSFDPDHVPVSGFLREVLGYLEDPQVGYVQAAQVYYNQQASFIARGAAEETYAYYSSIQMASYGMDYPIVVGCHTTHRTTALKQVGGFAAHDADDLLITLRYQAAGWRGVYVPKILAQGLTPVDWTGYIQQQIRWARSVLDIKFRIYPKLRQNLPTKTRAMSFLHGLHYVQDSVVTFLGLGLMVFMLAAREASVVFAHLMARLPLLFVTLQLCDFYRQRFYLGGRREWGIHWRSALLQLAKWPYILAAIHDVVVGRKFAYVLTPKANLQRRKLVLAWPHLLVACAIATAWAATMVHGRPAHPLVHLWAFLTIAGSLLLVLTERMRFPEPYNPNLRAKTPPATS